jgi:uncharacterized membrane protein
MLSEFTELAAAATMFVGSHFLLSFAPIRRRLVGALGQHGFLILYSIVALAAFVWMIWSFRLAPYYWVWGSPQWARILVFAVMPFALIFVVAGYLTLNPSAVMIGDYALKRDDPAPGIFKVTRHPVMVGIALWAFVHLLANGDLASILLFGSLLILAVGGILHIEAKRRAGGDARWQQLTTVTSIVPFAAIIGGRTRFSFSMRDWGWVALGLVLYAVLLHIHGWAFGVYLVGTP